MNFQIALYSALYLSYADLHEALCVFTDAAERLWAGAVTQTTL